jgi:translation initiation factor SUI1
MDPFQDQAALFSNEKVSKIHIRAQQMGSKWISTISGLDDDLDLAKIAKHMKKNLHCATSVSKNKEGAEVIQLQGDQRNVVVTWLTENKVLTVEEAKERIVIHGT